MDNISFNIVFTLSGMKESRVNIYMYVVFVSIVYLLIILFNLTVIVTIIRERALHEPMYIFLCNLCFNELWGTAGFYPQFLSNLLNDIYLISYNGCLLQIFVIYSYAVCEYATLLIMSYDRFVAICTPLEYHMKMTCQAARVFILFSWFYSLLSVSGGIILTSRLQLCGSYIHKSYCDNWSVVKLSCAPTTVNNVYGFFVILSAVLQGLFVVYSYIRLINACTKSNENKNKFMQTCVPHLLSLINFTIAILFDTMFSRYEARNFPQSLRNFLQLEFLIIPPLLNPIIYGLKLTEVRKRVFRNDQKVKNKDLLHKRKR